MYYRGHDRRNGRH